MVEIYNMENPEDEDAEEDTRDRPLDVSYSY